MLRKTCQLSGTYSKILSSGFLFGENYESGNFRRTMAKNLINSNRNLSSNTRILYMKNRLLSIVVSSLSSVSLFFDFFSRSRLYRKKLCDRFKSNLYGFGFDGGTEQRVGKCADMLCDVCEWKCVRVKLRNGGFWREALSVFCFLLA